MGNEMGMNGMNGINGINRMNPAAKRGRCVLQSKDTRTYPVKYFLFFFLSLQATPPACVVRYDKDPDKLGWQRREGE